MIGNRRPCGRLCCFLSRSRTRLCGFAGSGLQRIHGVELLGVQGQGSHQRVEDGLDFIALGVDFIGEIRLVLEGVQVDVAAVEGFVREVVGIEDYQVDVDVCLVLVKDILGGVPVLIGGAADADLPDGLTL